MKKIIIYHNPRSSKSRQVLALAQGMEYEIELILYIQNPIAVQDIRSLLQKLRIDASQLMRKNESLYRELHLNQESDDQLIEAIHQHPQLIERPIVCYQDSYIIARPPELINELLS